MSVFSKIANTKRPGLIREAIFVFGMIGACFLWWSVI